LRISLRPILPDGVRDPRKSCTSLARSPDADRLLVPCHPAASARTQAGFPDLGPSPAPRAAQCTTCQQSEPKRQRGYPWCFKPILASILISKRLVRRTKASYLVTLARARETGPRWTAQKGPTCPTHDRVFASALTIVGGVVGLHLRRRGRDRYSRQKSTDRRGQDERLSRPPDHLQGSSARPCGYQWAGGQPRQMPVSRFLSWTRCKGPGGSQVFSKCG